jgi:hypothetical protein
MLKRILTAAAAATLMNFVAPALAAGSLVDVQVIDRSSGATLPMYWHNGRWWVPGKPGNRYAVALTNRSGGRALTVISVDGVNVISGETAAPDQTGYVLSHGQFAQITGWRKNMSRVAAFEFTSLADSYAARTGRPDNVGVIGVAVFRERSRPIPPPVLQSRPDERQSPAPSASSAGASNEAASPEAKADRSQGALARRESRIGTGHGRSEHAPTSYTDFERAQSSPNETIVIHYDSRENLVAMGVIPQPHHVPNPFPAPVGFVPDPPR